MYYRKEQVSKLLECGVQGFKCFISDFEIEATQIKNELLYSQLSIEKAIDEIKKIHETYRNSYYTANQCKEMGISFFTITHKLERIAIPNKYRYFEYKKLSCLFLKEQSYFNVKNELIRFREAIEMLPFTATYGQKYLKDILEQYNFSVDYTLDRGFGHVYKSDILTLLDLINERYSFNKENYITIRQCRDMGLEKSDMKLLDKKKPEYLDSVHEFKSVLMLYDKKSAEKLLMEKEATKKENSKLICEKDIMTQLGFTQPKKFQTILEAYGITSLKRNYSYEKKLYRMEDFIELKKIIFERYKFNRENFYSAKELKEMGVIPYEHLNFSAIKSEFIDHVFEFSDVQSFYQQSEIKEYLHRISESNIKRLTINEEKISHLQNLNLEHYIITDGIKDLFNYSSRQILPFAKKYNLPLNIVSVRRRKYTNARYRVTDTYFLIEDIVNIIDYKKHLQKTEQAKKLLQQQERKKQLILQKKSEKLLKQQEKEIAKQLTLQRREEKKLLKKAKKKATNSKELTIEKYIRVKMLEYKQQLLAGENIKKLFLGALVELNYIDEGIIENNEFNMWVNFLIKKLNLTSTNGRTLYKKFSTYLSLTKYNYALNLFNDLPEISTKALNNMFFSKSTQLGKQGEVYTFLKFYASKKETNYNFLELNNPHTIKKSITNKNRNKKDIYSIEEYLQLIQYVCDISIHKKEIESWHKKKIPHNVKYRSYESVWLYVILSLNNMWRNFDILTKVPIVNIPSRFQTLEDYYKQDLTLEESQIIIFELISKYKTFKSTKADKDGHFFCSDELVVPLANALVACILYKNVRGNLYVIEQGPDFTLAPLMQKAFFRNFAISNFNFKSKKMNSTISTYSYEYVKKYTNENPIKITSFMRPHTDINTTNHYINLPQEQLEQITRNLFEGGYFGYTFDYMYKLITGKSINLLEFNNKRNVITIFKNAHKIENISKQLLFIENKYESLHQYLNSLKKEEVEHQLNLINLKQLPAKEEHWQCILGECLYLNRSCISCPFAIPHFYSLTACIESLIMLIDKYKNHHLESRGENRFLANRIFQYLLYLSDAKKEFGSEFLNEFSNNKYNTILNEILNIPNLTKHLTIPRGDI